MNNKYVITLLLYNLTIASTDIKAPRGESSNEVISLNLSNQDCICEEIIGNNATIFGSVSIGDNLQVDHQLHVHERAIFDRNVSVGDTLIVGKDVSIHDDLTVHDDAMINHNLNVGRNLNIGKNATIHHDLFVHHNESIHDNLTIGGTLFVPHASISILDVGSLSVGDLNANSLSVCDLTVGCSLITEPSVHVDFSGNVTIGGSLFVADDASIGGNLSVIGNENILGNISIAGNETINGTLFGNDASFNSLTVGVFEFGTSISVTNASICNLTVGCSLITEPATSINLEGNVTVGGNLSITGNTNLNQLSTHGPAHVGGALFADADTTINGAIMALTGSIAHAFSVNGSLVAVDTSLENVVTNSLSISGDEIIDGSLFIGGDLSITGNETINGTIFGNDASFNHLSVQTFVFGTSIETSFASVCDLTIGCSLITEPTASVNLEGNVTIGESLFVTHDVSLGGNLSVAGNEFLTGNESIGGNLSVVGNESLGGNLSVTGLGSFAGTLIAGCDLSVGCNIDMVNSTNAAHGNVNKAGTRFMSNFGTGNTFLGAGSGNFALTGTDNTGVGADALTADTTGSSNVAVGSAALIVNTTGGSNIAIGNGALVALTTGSNNIALGTSAGALLTTSSNNIEIGNVGILGDSGVIRIGTSGTHTTTFISGIRGVTTGVADAVNVLIDSNGQLGTVSSSKRYKENIQRIDRKALFEKMTKILPVSFSYKSDPTHKLIYGMIAEELEEIMPELVIKDKDGNPETIAYHLFTPLLLAIIQELSDSLNNLRAEYNEYIKKGQKVA